MSLRFQLLILALTLASVPAVGGLALLFHAVQTEHDCDAMTLKFRRLQVNARLNDVIGALGEPDARHFGCVAEVSHTREILARGTSAHRQLAVFDRAVAEGASRGEALVAVVDWLIAETASGL